MIDSASLELYLPDSEACLAFGRILGLELAGLGLGKVVLLYGDLGAGKTTLVRGFVSGLPGAGQAEVSSPSFNIVNIYPTQPPVAHADFYRLMGAEAEAALYDCLEATPQALVLVEWAERLSGSFPEALRINMSLAGEGRRACLSHGGDARLLKRLRPLLADFKE